MNNGYTHRVIGRLREAGLKVTPQRIAIVRYLDGNDRHPTVEEIHREVLHTFPTISLATVYNTLDTLARIREVQVLTIDPVRRHYDPDTQGHHHLICTECGCIADVYADYSDHLQLPEELTEKFALQAASVHFRGVCKDCDTPALN